MGKIKGWRKVRDTSDNVIYTKISSDMRLSLTKVRPKYWNVNLYEKEKEGFRFLGNLQRGLDDKRQAKKWALNYMSMN